MALQNRALVGGVVMPEVSYHVELTAREFDHVLAGLRLYQRAIVPRPEGVICLPSCFEIATEHGPELSFDQLEGLCTRLNGAQS